MHYHTGLGRKAGLTQEQLQALDHFDGSDAFTDLQKLALRFAEQWTQQGKVKEDVVAALAQTLSPTQIIVLAATVGLANWTGRFNETFEVQLP